MKVEALHNILGLDVEKLEPYQMAFRAAIIFFVSLCLVRIAGIRTFGKQSAFDILTSLMLGAIMGRAVVTDQSFFGSILAALVIMLLHRLIAWLSFRSRKIGVILKGTNVLLIKNGKKQEKNLSRSNITEDDILEALRRDIHITSLDKIKEVYLERSGDISIIEEQHLS